MKFFDRYQKIIVYVGIVSVILSFIFLMWNVATATPVYDEQGLLAGYEYMKAPQTLYSITFGVNGLCFTWFVIRSITFTMRKKEERDINIPTQI